MAIVVAGAGLGLVAGCAKGGGGETSCQDGQDNDGDGRTDCDDTDCSGDPACQAGCGDGVQNGDEECDGDDLAGQSCLDLGYDGGRLSCNANCFFDTAECGFSVCGNDIAEGGESCDGPDLAGESCITQGYVGGDLACTSTCDYDVSACEVDCGSVPLGTPTSERAARMVSALGQHNVLYYAVVGWGGGPYLLSIELYGDAVPGGLTSGSVTLGQGDDGNYATCGHCVTLGECADTSCETLTRKFFAIDGTLRIDHLPDSAAWTLRGALTAAKWVEVEIDHETYASSRVVGGQCFELNSPYNFDTDVEESEICGDGIDNDSDGLIDCDDGDCFGEAINCSVEQNCGDRLDNDRDGLPDCEDDDCALEPACAPRAGVFEAFGYGDPTDLRAHQIAFTRDASAPGGYQYAVTPVGAGYPETMGNGTTSVPLTLADQDFYAHDFISLPSFAFYGVDYTRIYVGSNGVITFGAGQAQEDAGVAGFLSNGPKIAAFGLNLDPSAGGQVVIDDYVDRVVVTWDAVPEFITGRLVSVQAVLHATGEITLSYPFDLPLSAGIVGVTVGAGVAPDPSETDFVTFPTLVINEVGYNDAAVDDQQFVEIHGPAGTDLSNFWIVHHDGTTGGAIWSVSLQGETMPADGLFVFGAPTVPRVDLDWDAAQSAGRFTGAKRLDHGPDSVVLYAHWNGQEGVPLDGVGWDSGGFQFRGEGTPAPDLTYGRWNTTIGRSPDGRDTDDNGNDFVVAWWPTPGMPNTAAGPGAGFERVTGSVFSAPALPASIPDNDAAGLSLSIDIGSLGWFVGQSVNDVHVAVRVSHVDTSQLRVALVGPDGTTSVQLHNRAAGTWIEAVYDLSLPPASGAMSDFNGLDPRGEWRLDVIDDVAGGTGQVLEWVLWINGAVIQQCGDGVQQGSELCDGADVTTQDCSTVGQPLSGGTLTCNATCDGYDYRGCLSACGAEYLGVLGSAPIVFDGDTCTATSDFNPGAAGCTGAAAAGKDVVHQVHVPAGRTVTAHMISMVDNALYVLTSCSDTAGTTCVDGSDSDDFPLYEEWVTFAAGGSDTTFYLVTDAGAAADCGRYTLTVQ